jgi:hypothetical protein
MSEPAARQRHVICMKWGTKYGPEYVNRLYAMVRRHLSGDFHLVCLTDDTAGIRSEVQCPDSRHLDLPPGIPERGWTKLVSFSAKTCTACAAPPCFWTWTWSSPAAWMIFSPSRASS